jgi:serine protease Do
MNRYVLWAAAGLPLALALGSGMARTDRPPAGAGTRSQAPYSRRTPVVEAVEKTYKGIVTLKVARTNGFGRREGVSTGVVVDERGYLITNAHAVAGAEVISAHLHDGTSLRASVHTAVPECDLAILKVPAAKAKLQALTFGPGSDLLVGETVIAVGNPFGYTNTVSTGIISALGREVTVNEHTLRNLIQTNASINPGNSGGPLLNINGELIGINVALREGAQGIAFALNADTVKAALSKHLSAGKVARVGHGLVCREHVASEGGARQRVVVDEVAEGSPAARAGVRKGDVILKVADRAVQNRFDVERALWSYKAGDKVEAAILRAGKAATVALTLTRGDSGRVIPTDSRGK